MKRVLKSNISILILFFVLSILVFWKLFLLSSGERLYLTSDFVHYWNILFYAVKYSLKDLFFDPYQFLGSSLIGRVDLGIFYPPVLLMVLAGKLLSLNPFSFYVALEFLAVLHIGLAGFFAYILARKFINSFIGSLLAGITFAFSGYFFVSINALSLVNSSVWLPAYCFFLVSFIRKKHFGTLLGAAVSLAMSFLAGIPQITLYTFLFGILLSVWEFVHKKEVDFRAKTRAVISTQVIILFILGVIISIPLFFQLPASSRSNRNTMSYTNTALQGSISPIFVTDYFIPHFFDTEENIVKSFFSQNYLGVIFVISMILFPFLIKTKKNYFFFFSFFLFLILGMGGESLLHDWSYLFVPGVKLFRNISKLNLLVSLSGAMVVAMVTDRLMNLTQTLRRKISTVLLHLSLISMFVFGMLVSQPLINFRTSLAQNPPAAQEISLFKKQSEDILLQGLFFAVIIIALLYLVRSKKNTFPVFLLSLFAVVDITRFNHHVPQNNSPLDPARAYSQNSYLSYLITDKDIFRVSYPSGPLPANYAPEVVEVENLGGYSSLIPEVSSNLQQLLAKHAQTASYSKIAGFMNQKYVVSDETFNWPGYKQVFTYKVSPEDTDYFCPGSVAWVPCPPGKIFSVYQNTDYFKRIEVLHNPEVVVENSKDAQLRLVEKFALEGKDFRKFMVASDTVQSSQTIRSYAPQLPPVFSASVEAGSEDTLLISMPFDQNLLLFVDGKLVIYNRANYGFISYTLPKTYALKTTTVSLSTKIF